MSRWVRACAVDDVDNEDVIPVTIEGHHYAIYRSPDDTYYATDGQCTHEKVLLADGLVMGHVIECPKHNGRYDYRTGTGLCAPIVESLRTYPARVEGGAVEIDVDANTKGLS
jgi:3-phenylpropionate/trans-cinnamate dioxygenase ferredoxin component